MKNKMIVLSMIISSLFAGEFGGYSIFEYSNQAFEISRVYLQYTDDLADDLFLKIRYDVGRDGVDKDGRFVNYLKNAYVDWKRGENGKFSFGMISTNSYGAQESTWGYRFIARSTADYHKFTNTADLGMGYSHKFGDINISAQILNGEGYKSKQTDDYVSTYLRVMYGEAKLNKNDGYNIGLVMTQNNGMSDNIMELDDEGVECAGDNDPEGCNANYGQNIVTTYADSDNKNLISLFAGWSKNNLRIGFDHNSFESWNSLSEMLETQTVQSLYVNYSISETMDVFMKYNSGEWWVEDDNGDDVLTKDQSIAWVGGVWNATNGLYISPNVIIEDGSNDYRLTFMFKY